MICWTEVFYPRVQNENERDTGMLSCPSILVPHNATSAVICLAINAGTVLPSARTTGIRMRLPVSYGGECFTEMKRSYWLVVLYTYHGPRARIVRRLEDVLGYHGVVIVWGLSIVLRSSYQSRSSLLHGAPPDMTVI
ncbi:hypothetical protein H4582DRAFT_1547587 [Lactarius indigo]|nr:hypothetical protein H4582DRAFT_1547587 [Lactarius indigo]